MRAVKIDANGFFLADIPGDPAYSGEAGTAPAPAGDAFTQLKPRWDGQQWTEGADAAAVATAASAARAASERQWRNGELVRADNKVRNAQDRGNATSETAWRAYRVQLRDMPEQNIDPLKWVRPVAPVNG